MVLLAFKGPLWLAATVQNAVPDVWGSMYAVALNLSTAPVRQAAMDTIANNKSAYFSAGQIRSLPAGVYVGAPRGPLHAGRSTRGAPRGALHGGGWSQIFFLY